MAPTRLYTCTCSAKCIRDGYISKATYYRHAARRRLQSSLQGGADNVTEREEDTEEIGEPGGLGLGSQDGEGFRLDDGIGMQLDCGGTGLGNDGEHARLDDFGDAGEMLGSGEDNGSDADGEQVSCLLIFSL